MTSKSYWLLKIFKKRKRKKVKESKKKERNKPLKYSNKIVLYLREDLIHNSMLPFQWEKSKESKKEKKIISFLREWKKQLFKRLLVGMSWCVGYEKIHNNNYHTNNKKRRKKMKSVKSTMSRDLQKRHGPGPSLKRSLDNNTSSSSNNNNSDKPVKNSSNLLFSLIWTHFLFLFLFFRMAMIRIQSFILISIKVNSSLIFFFNTFFELIFLLFFSSFFQRFSWWFWWYWPLLKNH